jgi:hypothetical protein
MSRFAPRLLIAAAAAAACFAAASAHAQVVNYFTDGSVANIPALTGSATTGADMSGMSVRASFSSGKSEVLSWAMTGAESGGVTGTGWSLSLSGDSYGTHWLFDFEPRSNLGELEQLILNGSTGLTVFDRDLPDEGTPFSGAGVDFRFAAGTCVGCVANAIYGFETSVGAAAALGDLHQSLTINFFKGSGPSDDWQFSQDTDGVVASIPEPETYALMLGGLGVIGWVGRRRRNANSMSPRLA